MQEGQSTPENNDNQPTNWQFQPGTPSGGLTQVPANPTEPAGVNWTASEFIAHHKNASWYMALAGITILATIVVYLFTKDKISAVVVIVVSICFGVIAARKPRVLQYSVNSDGVHMGEKFYPYSLFKSFSLVEEDAAESIWLMPLKRFMPIMTMYFDPADQDRITQTLSAFLPLENREPDVVDKFMHRIRF
jgi:hypothetical protein